MAAASLLLQLLFQVSLHGSLQLFFVVDHVLLIPKNLHFLFTRFPHRRELVLPELVGLGERHQRRVDGMPPHVPLQFVQALHFYLLMLLFYDVVLQHSLLHHLIVAALFYLGPFNNVLELLEAWISLYRVKKKRPETKRLLGLHGQLLGVVLEVHLVVEEHHLFEERAAMVSALHELHRLLKDLLLRSLPPATDAH